MGLIAAKSREELRLQLAAKMGRTSKEIADIESTLLELSADFAAYSDFPDEDLEELSPENFSRLLKKARQGLEGLISTYDSGRVLREGIKTAIIGKPNVGKSTLMNLLSKEERSIVTDVAGTTRDVIENTVNIGSITLILADTAGIRATDDLVEEVGVRLATDRIGSSQLTLAVFDCSSPLDADDRDILTLLDPATTLIVLNKSDKGQMVSDAHFPDFTTVLISAKQGNGADEL